jgi:hypothetical protein
MEYQLVHGYRPPDERAFTDHHMVELSRRHYPAVQAKLFTNSEEADTGADLELWFHSNGDLLGTLVQAKKLDPQLRYAGLARTVGARAGASRQIDLLVAACTVGAGAVAQFVGYEPLYIFYNGPTRSGTALAADRCANRGVGDRQRGCTVARAGDVRAALDAPGGPHEDAGTIARLAWPWQCLLCCPKARQDSLVERVAAFLSVWGANTRSSGGGGRFGSLRVRSVAGSVDDGRSWWGGRSCS